MRLIGMIVLGTLAAGSAFAETQTYGSSPQGAMPTEPAALALLADSDCAGRTTHDLIVTDSAGQLLITCNAARSADSAAGPILTRWQEREVDSSFDGDGDD